ncbi:hypothetical protein REPUB_Repub01dG0164600 [Reevesia pubescens]
MRNAAEMMKESLAKILVKFYPFAGCLTITWDEKMVVRCSGEGVPFVEAVSNSTIEELGDISRVDSVKLRQLVHYLDDVETIVDVLFLTMQVCDPFDETMWVQTELVQKPFSFAVKIVHKAIKEVNEDYIKSAIDYYELTRGGLEMENTCWISKWSRLTFYELDFVWGKRQQVAPASMVDNLVLTLAQEKDSKSLILSLGLLESVMKIFQELMPSELKQK